MCAMPARVMECVYPCHLLVFGVDKRAQLTRQSGAGAGAGAQPGVVEHGAACIYLGCPDTDAHAVAPLATVSARVAPPIANAF